MTMRVLIPGGIGLVMLGSSLQAGEVESAQVEKEGSYYHLTLRMQVDGAPAAVYGIVTDYARLERISPVIVRSDLLESRPDGRQRRRLVTRACIWFFCIDAIMVEDIRESGAGVIMATMVPELSDYRYGRSQWRVRPHGHGTRIDFEATLDPDYWVPPIIGPWLMEQKMRDEAGYVICALEALSRDGD